MSKALDRPQEHARQALLLAEALLLGERDNAEHLVTDLAKKVISDNNPAALMYPGEGPWDYKTPVRIVPVEVSGTTSPERAAAMARADMRDAFSGAPKASEASEFHVVLGRVSPTTLLTGKATEISDLDWTDQKAKWFRYPKGSIGLIRLTGHFRETYDFDYLVSANPNLLKDLESTGGLFATVPG